MILPCPFCQTRFLVSASLFAAGPRKVRCARCSHNWLAELPKEIDAVGPPPVLDVEPIPDGPRPIPPGSNLPAVIKTPLSKWLRGIIMGIGGTVVFIVLMWFVFDRQDIAKEWPSLERFYDDVGLHIYHVGEGLSIEGVRSELRYEDGIMKLYIEGRIRNETKKTQEIPNIVAGAIGSDGVLMQSWQIDAPAATLGPQETIAFHSSINGPRETVVEVNLNFIEPKAEPTHAAE